MVRGLKLIHFVDLVDDNKWSQLSDSIYEWKSPVTVEILNSLPVFGKKILEVGCSTGQVTKYLGHNCAEVLRWTRRNLCFFMRKNGFKSTWNRKM